MPDPIAPLTQALSDRYRIERELGEGESLDELMEREGQLPLDRAIAIVGEVTGALAYAHARGVVHRDIKPGNIMLEGGHAVVTDFGVASAVEAAAGTKLTQTGMSVGTPPRRPASSSTSCPSSRKSRVKKMPSPDSLMAAPGDLIAC